MYPQLHVYAFYETDCQCQYLLKSYCISSVIRQKCFSFQNNPKNLDPSYKMHLDLWDCLGGVKLVFTVVYLKLRTL